jgi:hypothetical protein
MLRYNSDNNRYILECEWGQTLTSFLEKLILISTEKNTEISGTFNDYEFIINQAINPVTVESLRAEFTEYNRQQDEIYQNSNEGKLASLKRAQKLKNSQHHIDILIEKLDSLDFDNFGAVLEWMCLFQIESDQTGVVYYEDLVVETFIANGYEIGVNTGEQFNPKDQENVCKYIIGQALDGIDRVGAPHQIIHKFANDWKQKFLVKA